MSWTRGRTDRKEYQELKEACSLSDASELLADSMPEPNQRMVMTIAAEGSAFTVGRGRSMGMLGGKRIRGDILDES